MATVNAGIVGEIDATERNGVVTKLVCLARVTGLSDNDPQVLTSALAACTTAGYSVGSTLTGYPANLVLVERSPRLTDDKTVVDVSLSYETDTRSQGVAGLAFGFLLARIKTSLSQATAYVDRYGNPITVTHVYPTTDKRFGNATLAERTFTKAVPVQALRPQIELEIQQIRATSDPDSIAQAIAGKVNQSAWFGGAARTWLCTGVSIDPVSSSADPPTFSFTYTFQKNSSTWDPVAVFVDDNGAAPENLVEGVGSVQVQIHEEADFESVLQARVYNG